MISKKEFKTILKVSALLTIAIVIVSALGWTILQKSKLFETEEEIIVDDTLGFLSIKITESQKTSNGKWIYRSYVSIDNVTWVKKITDQYSTAEFEIKITGTPNLEIFSESHIIDNVTFYKNHSIQNKMILMNKEVSIMHWIFDDSAEVIEIRTVSEYRLTNISAKYDVWKEILHKGTRYSLPRIETHQEKWAVNEEVKT